MAEQGGSGSEYEILTGKVVIDGDKATGVMEKLGQGVTALGAGFAGLQSKITAAIGTLVAFGASWKGLILGGLGIGSLTGLIQGGIAIEKLDKQLKAFSKGQDEYAKKRLEAFSEKYDYPLRDAQAAMVENLRRLDDPGIIGKEAVDRTIRMMSRSADIAAVRGLEREDVMAAYQKMLKGEVGPFTDVLGLKTDELEEAKKEYDKTFGAGLPKAERERELMGWAEKWSAQYRGGYARQDDLTKDWTKLVKALDEVRHAIVKDMIPEMRVFVQKLTGLIEAIPAFKEKTGEIRADIAGNIADTAIKIRDIFETEKKDMALIGGKDAPLSKVLDLRSRSIMDVMGVLGDQYDKSTAKDLIDAAFGALKKGGVGTSKFLNEIAVPGPKKASDLIPFKDSLGGPQSAAPKIIINQHGVNMNDPAAVKTAAMTGAEEALQRLLGRSKFYGTEKLA